MIKQAEAEFAAMCKRNNVWAHKWRDVSYCPNCRRPIFVTKRTNPADQRPEEEQESIIDYLIYDDRFAWVECKGKGYHTRLPLKEINTKQDNFMRSWIKRGIASFLFVTLGPGRAPKERKAWLIPYAVWLEKLEPHSVLSLFWTSSNRVADTITMDAFSIYELAWIKGGWSVEGHYLERVWTDLPSLYE